MPMTVKSINVKAGKRYVFNTHINEMLLAREEAESIEAFRVIIEPGNQTHLHVHDDTEQLCYVISGTGRIVFAPLDGSQATLDIVPQDVVHVPRNTEHQVFCTSEEALTYLCVDGFPLGKPRGEPTWEDHYRAVTKLQEKLKS